MDLKNKVIIFDLDDTLYKEEEFLISGFKEIIKKIHVDYNIVLKFRDLLRWFKNGENVFEKIINEDLNNRVSFDYLLNIYRFHQPNIKLKRKTKELLNNLKNKGAILGIMTDGRSLTQRNKINALEVNNYMNDILISEEFGSEKPSIKNYLFFQEKYPNYSFYYVGDNIIKDFITPNSLNWCTVGLKDLKNKNTHSQTVNVSVNHLPKYWINEIYELEYILKSL